MKKELVVFGIVVLLIGIALSGCVSESKKTITYAKLMSDVKMLPNAAQFTLQSYTDGQVLYIEDTVYNTTYFEMPESQGITFVGFGNSTSLEGFPICVNGDKRSEYPIGSKVTIPVHVKSYDINGTSVIWLEEWYVLYNLTQATGVSKSIKLTSADDRENVALHVGDTVNLTLKDYGDGGYAWHIVELDKSVLNLTMNYTWGRSDLLGDWGNDTWIFTAVDTGIAILKLASYREWEGPENATMNFTANIEVIV